MKKNINIAEILPKAAFWEFKMETLDVDRDIAMIIPRALFYTTQLTFEHDIKILESIYKREDIVTHLKKTREPISNKTFELVASRYQIPVFSRFTPPQKRRNRQLVHA